MKIEINGQEYDVPPDYINKLAGDLGALVEQMYETMLDDKLKAALMLITRGLLVKEELSIRAKHGKEAARAMRPPPKSDPNLWLIRLLLPSLAEILKNATIACETESDIVTAFSLAIPNQSFAGRQVDLARDKRLREDNSAQIP